MGLQISRGVYPEAAQEGDLRRITQTPRRDISRVGAAKGMQGCRRPFDD